MTPELVKLRDAFSALGPIAIRLELEAYGDRTKRGERVTQFHQFRGHVVAIVTAARVCARYSMREQRSVSRRPALLAFRDPSGWGHCTRSAPPLMRCAPSEGPLFTLRRQLASPQP